MAQQPSMPVGPRLSERYYRDKFNRYFPMSITFRVPV